MAKRKDLTPRKKRFCELIVSGMSTCEAALRVGYTNATAKTKSYKWLESETIKNYINTLNEKITSDNIASAIEIQEKLTAMARGEVQEEVICILSNETGSYIEKTTKQITPKDQLKALETLAKIKGMYKDTPDVPITININPSYE